MREESNPLTYMNHLLIKYLYIYKEDRHLLVKKTGIISKHTAASYFHIGFNGLGTLAVPTVKINVVTTNHR